MKALFECWRGARAGVAVTPAAIGINSSRSLIDARRWILSTVSLRKSRSLSSADRAPPTATPHHEYSSANLAVVKSRRSYQSHTRRAFCRIHGDQPMSSQSATRSIIYLGMDVHKESITIALLPADAKLPTRVDRLPNDVVKLKRWLDRAASQGELRACY